MLAIISLDDGENLQRLEGGNDVPIADLEHNFSASASNAIIIRPARASHYACLCKHIIDFIIWMHSTKSTDVPRGDPARGAAEHMAGELNSSHIIVIGFAIDHEGFWITVTATGKTAMLIVV